MPYIDIDEENSASIDLYYEDHGSGPPVVLIHGYPFSGRAWDRQIPVLLDAGYRVVTYDRRGFGESGKPWFGYDFDTLSADLDAVITELALHDVSLVGHSMGCGEIARYVASYGSYRVRSATFISTTLPFMLHTPDNPRGMDPAGFHHMGASVEEDLPRFLSTFLDDHFNLDVLGGTLVSSADAQMFWNIATQASPKACYDLIEAMSGTDFRRQLKNFDVPTMVIHGHADRLCPFDQTGRRVPILIDECQLRVIDDGPHGIEWTHADRVNEILLEFLPAAPRRPARAAER